MRAITHNRIKKEEAIKILLVNRLKLDTISDEISATNYRGISRSREGKILRNATKLRKCVLINSFSLSHKRPIKTC